MWHKLQSLGIKSTFYGIFTLAIVSVLIGSGLTWRAVETLRQLQRQQVGVFKEVKELKTFETSIYEANLLGMDIIVDKGEGTVSTERMNRLKELKEYLSTNKDLLHKIAHGLSLEPNMDDALEQLNKLTHTIQESIDAVNRHEAHNEVFDKADDIIDEAATEAKAKLATIRSRLDIKFEEIDAEVTKNSELVLFALSMQSLVILFSLLIIGMPSVSAFVRSLSQAAMRLKDANNSLASATQQLSGAARSLTNSITGQNASVTETVAAMTEIQSVITRNTSGLKEASHIAENARNLSLEGSTAMSTMARAIDDLAQTNQNLLHVVEIIDKISTKTGLINNIVFKTQMLSFNASIEAARAGANGRGFAVVATEVGRLAEVSGNAANEISNLLEESRSAVADLVNRVKAQVDETAGLSKSTVARFSQIVDGVAKVSDRIQDVERGAQEQIIGIDQCVKAMTKLDSLAQENSSVVSRVEQISSRLQSDFHSLLDASRTTESIIWGQQSVPPQALTQQASPLNTYAPSPSKPLDTHADAELINILHEKAEKMRKESTQDTFNKSA